MSTHNSNYEPTSRVNYERTTPNPYLNSSYLPPPPPEYYMHQRTGKAWKVAIPVVLLLLGVAVGILAYPLVNARLNPSSGVSKATPYVPFGLPAVTPTVNASYTARDIMKHILSNGVQPASIDYSLSPYIWAGDTLHTSVAATSSVTWTEGCSGGNYEPDNLGIWVYRNHADTEQAYSDVVQINYEWVLTPPTGPSSSPGIPYLHGRCLLVGAGENSIPWQVVTKYCI